MPNNPFTPPAWHIASLLAVCLFAATVPAQAPPAAQHKPSEPMQPDTKVANPDELLAKASKLYYSYAATGLDGFDCAVHPDWKKIVLVSKKGAPDPADERHIQLLNTVKVSLHAHLKGESSLGWDEPQASNALDKDSTAVLVAMHQATQQTLQGFLQFWTPFINGSIVPTSSEGLDVTQTGNGYKVEANQNGTSVTEVFDSKLVLQEFHVFINGMTVNFTPTYKPTDKGLLVSTFVARIQQPGATPDATAQSQQMHVTIDYQTVDEFPVPAQLSMDVVGTGTLNFVLDACTVSRVPN
jgi:hypothetical protein